MLLINVRRVKLFIEERRRLFVQGARRVLVTNNETSRLVGRQIIATRTKILHYPGYIMKTRNERSEGMQVLT